MVDNSGKEREQGENEQVNLISAVVVEVVFPFPPLCAVLSVSFVIIALDHFLSTILVGLVVVFPLYGQFHTAGD